MATYTKTGYMYFNFYYDGTQYTRFRIGYTQTEDPINETYTLTLTSFGFTSSYRYRWSGSVSTLVINGTSVSMSGTTSVSGLYLSSLGTYDSFSITPSPATLGPFTYSSNPKITGSIKYSWTPLGGGDYLSGTASAGTTTGGSISVSQIHSHSYTSSITTQPTCENTGVRTYTCECEKSYTETIAALGHNYQFSTTVAPTCTAQGYDIYICQNDSSHIENRNYTDMIGHNYNTTIINPTCIDQGYDLHVCANCGHTIRDTYVAALGHSFSEWNITVEPEFQKEGEATRTCSRCGTIEKKILEALTEALFRAIAWINGNKYIVKIAQKIEEGKIDWISFSSKIGNKNSK